MLTGYLMGKRRFTPGQVVHLLAGLVDVSRLIAVCGHNHHDRHHPRDAVDTTAQSVPTRTAVPPDRVRGLPHSVCSGRAGRERAVRAGHRSFDSRAVLVGIPRAVPGGNVQATWGAMARRAVLHCESQRALHVGHRGGYTRVWKFMGTMNHVKDRRRLELMVALPLTPVLPPNLPESSQHPVRIRALPAGIAGERSVRLDRREGFGRARSDSRALGAPRSGPQRLHAGRVHRRCQSPHLGE